MDGQELRVIREQLGFTQEQLAREVGVHKNTVARWERDELSIRESTSRLLQFVAASIRERSAET